MGRRQNMSIRYQGTSTFKRNFRIRITYQSHPGKLSDHGIFTIGNFIVGYTTTLLLIQKGQALWINGGSRFQSGGFYDFGGLAANVYLKFW